MRNNHRLYGLLAGAAVAAITSGLPAAAQAPNGGASAPSAPSASSAEVDEIVVTAEKRSESIQSVPLAVSALSGAQLEQAGQSNFRDIVLDAPSVSFQDRDDGDSKVVIRGISSGIVREAQTASTGYYIDDVPMTASYTAGGTDITLFDIQRVEVLRGPQGTLYGAGAEGGAIRVITNQPNLSAYAGDVEVTASEIAQRAAHVDVRGMVNIPIVDDKLALRLVGIYTYDQGYVKDLQGQRIDGGGITGGRAALTWAPTSNLKVDLTGLYQHTYYGSPPEVDLSLSGQPIWGDLTRNLYTKEYNDLLTEFVNLTINYQMPWATLTSSTSYVYSDTKNAGDGTLADGVILPLFGLPVAGYSGQIPGSNESVVEEARLVSTETHPLSWVVGGYISNSNINVARTDQFELSPVAEQFQPFEWLAKTQQQTYSGFGEATYHFTDQWALTAGARYTYVHSFIQSRMQGLFLGLPLPSQALFASGPGSTSDFSPKAELTYTPTSNFLFYAEVARGFRPGSANVSLPPSFNIPSIVQPDHLWDYEFGAKTQFFDHHLIVDADVYLIDWTHMQLVGLTHTTPLIPYFANGPDAVSRGAELEAHFLPDPHWQFSLSGAYTDAHFTQASASVGVVPGERIASVPLWSGSFAIDYTHAITDSITGFAHFDIRGQSDTNACYSAPLCTGVTTPAYTLSNLRIGADLPNKFQVTLFVDNLFDKRAETEAAAGLYCTTITCPSFNVTKNAEILATIVQPRTVGLTVSKKF